MVDLDPRFAVRQRDNELANVSHLLWLTWMHSNVTRACSHIPVLGTVPSITAASIFVWHPGLHKSPLRTAWGKLAQIICSHS